MAFNKVTYVDGETVIYAQNLNDIQDEIINQKNAISQLDASKAPVIINTASGDIASFADGADGGQIRKIVGTIVTAEGGSGYTECTISNNMLNLFDPNSVTISANRYIDADGAVISNDYHDLTSALEIFGGVEYTFSNEFNSNAPSTVLVAFFYNSSMELIGRSGIRAEETGAWSGDIKMPETAKYVRLSIAKTKKQSPSPFLTMQMFYKTRYTKTISWLDQAGTILNGTITLNEDASADVVNSVSGNSYHLTDVGNVYTGYGANNISIDTGSISECDYPADTKLFLTARDEEITGNIAPIENGTTASQAYAQGAYFWHDTKFCKALTAIASGATFTLNTNYTETTVAAELLAAQN